MRIVLMVFFILGGVTLSFGQCVLDGSDSNVSDSEVESCLTACSCNTIQITGVVNMNGDWTLSGVGDLTIEIKTGGRLVFSGNGGSADNLILSSGSVILIEDTNPDNDAILQTGGAGQNRITIGGSNFAGNTFSTIISSGGVNSSGPLPVELTHFAAQSKSNMVELAWTTATELNNDFFQVEHSRDGIQFQAIGKVKGEGTTTETINYHFMHRQPISGTNYYRLKQVDFDGAFEYSEIVVAEINSRAGGVQVFPNPTINKAFIQMADLPEKVDFNLSTLLGQRLEVQPTLSDGGWELDLSSLPRGIYILQMNYDGQSVSKRLVKE